MMSKLMRSTMAAPSSSSSFLILPLALALALLHVTAFASNLDGAEELHFGYTGQTGTTNWGKLNQECALGKLQSPVNIATKEAEENPKLKALCRVYRSAKATLINHGFNVGVQFDEDAGILSADGKNYSLKQIHWHTPSEHHIDGEQLPAELHLVHKASDGALAVVGVLYEYGSADPILSKLMNGLEELAKDECKSDEQSQVSIGSFPTTKLLKRNVRKYYRYNGSLTTPPCSQEVTWNIVGKLREISKEQVAALKAPLNSECKDNARPVQPLNGRRIQLYDEDSDSSSQKS